MRLEFEGAGAYRLITHGTIERDIALSVILKNSGAQDAMLSALGAGKNPDAAILDALSASGMLFDFLGAVLMPVADDEPKPLPRPWLRRTLDRLLGTQPPPAPPGHGGDGLKWTPEIGKATGEKLKHVMAPEAKRILTIAVVELVKGFFLAGLHSLVTSPNSLRELAERVTAEAQPGNGPNGATFN